MIKRIQRRFVLFTMAVIGLVMGIVAITMAVHSTSVQTIHRTIITVLLILGLVFLSSIVLSHIAMKPIKRAWQRQLDFTADASHELRTPLAIIRSNLEIVMDNPDDTVRDQGKWLDNIQKETNRMTKLVEDLLTLSRADSNETQLCMTEFPLSVIIEERLSAFHSLASQHGITIESKVAPDVLLHGDEQRITQLFTILLDNAIKYMGRPGMIRIEAACAGQRVQIIFSDDGVGIPKEDVPNVFTRFYRVDKSRTGQQGGSGLGLAIAKCIVEAHGGKITLKSGEGKGVVYNITI